MVQRGEAKLDCDEDCNAHKTKQKKETTKEEELRKQKELRAQQVILPEYIVYLYIESYTKRKILIASHVSFFFFQNINLAVQGDKGDIV